MTVPADVRGVLLQGLKASQLRHARDPHRHGLEALRLLRAAGLTWRDVLGEPFGEDDYPLRLLRYGHTPPDPAKSCGRAIMRALAHAQPSDLATAAVLVNRPDLSAQDLDALLLLTRSLMEAHERGTAAAHCAAASPILSSKAA